MPLTETQNFQKQQLTGRAEQWSRLGLHDRSTTNTHEQPKLTYYSQEAAGNPRQFCSNSRTSLLGRLGWRLLSSPPQHGELSPSRGFGFPQGVLSQGGWIHYTTIPNHPLLPGPSSWWQEKANVREGQAGTFCRLRLWRCFLCRGRHGGQTPTQAFLSPPGQEHCWRWLGHSDNPMPLTAFKSKEELLGTLTSRDAAALSLSRKS